MLPASSPKEKTLLGTFEGVFMPSFLTIMGVIIFLRMGFVMGNAGLLQGMIIILLANSISVITSLSVSAIATNIRVEGGGAYYLISRSLGSEFGGPIGLILFFSQAVSVAFYIIGFTEIFVAMIPVLEPAAAVIEVAVCIGLFFCASANIDWAAKMQFWILVFLGLGLVSFLIGGLIHFDSTILHANRGSAYLPRLSFWSVFAIFFPAITGFTQGVNLSGDLKKPEKSIPLGTLTAVGASFVLYLAFGFLVAGSTSRHALLGNLSIMRDVSVLPFLVDVGVICATLSSALTSFLGAPRILQALSRDNVFPLIKFFAVGYGPSQTPRRATFLTFVVAMICLLKGNLNAIAPIVTMCFLLAYGLMNYATFVEDFGNNPSFRPRFRFFHWRASLAGAVLCVLFMLFIHALAAVVALLLISLLYLFVDRTVKETSWGDAKRGFYFSKIKEYLLRLRDEPFHLKNWRPQMVVFSGRPDHRLAMVNIGLWLEAGRGMLTLAHIVPGTVADRVEIRKNEIASLQSFIVQHRLPVFWEVLVAPDYLQGVETLVQCHSVNGIKPNTVLLRWAEQKEKKDTFIRIIRSFEFLNKNIVLLHGEENLFRAGSVKEGKRVRDFVLDVWWRGEKNGNLMLLLAYLWTQNPECRKSRIRLLRLVESEEGRQKNIEHLKALVDQSRIEADVNVIVSDKPWREAVAEHSRSTDVVFLGLGVPKVGEEEKFFSTYGPLLDKLSTAILIQSVTKLDVRL